MKKLKNKIILLLTLTVLLFVSCAKDAKTDDGRLSVVTTNFALYDFARSVCGDEADVIMLLPVGTDSHDFEATLGDIDKIASADLFIHTGGESEDWVDDVFATLDSMGMTVNSICAADEVETYTEKELEGMQEEDEHEHDHEHNHSEESIDEHVWTSVPNAVKIIEKIRDEVSSLSPDIAEKVKSNSDSYIATLNAIDNDIADCVKNAKRNILVFADRFPFRYFAERYSLECYAAFSGCTSNTEPTLATINFLIDKVREENIPDVLITELSDRKCAEAVAGETGCGILQLSSAHNVTKEEFEAGVTYADLMRDNLEVLKIVLN